MERSLSPHCLCGEEIKEKILKIRKIGLQPTCLNIQTESFASFANFIKIDVQLANMITSF